MKSLLQLSVCTTHQQHPKTPNPCVTNLLINGQIMLVNKIIYHNYIPQNLVLFALDALKGVGGRNSGDAYNLLI